jgi:hypothetical protein
VVTRLARASRIWTVRWTAPLRGQEVPESASALIRAMSAMRLLGRWRIQSVILSLYAARRAG